MLKPYCSCSPTLPSSLVDPKYRREQGKATQGPCYL